MSAGRLVAWMIAALAFALYETGVAYVRPDGPNCLWAGFAWICVLFVAGLIWESRRKK
jgi:hypothetical protein